MNNNVVVTAWCELSTARWITTWWWQRGVNNKVLTSTESIVCNLYKQYIIVRFCISKELVVATTWTQPPNSINSVRNWYSTHRKDKSNRARTKKRRHTPEHEYRYTPTNTHMLERHIQRCKHRHTNHIVEWKESSKSAHNKTCQCIMERRIQMRTHRNATI
jgi:hypothetical protein